MANLYYKINSGTPNFTVHIEPEEASNQVHSSLGIYSFLDIPAGTYSLIVTDSLGCIVEIDNINIQEITTTTTTTTETLSNFSFIFLGTEIRGGCFEIYDIDGNSIYNYTINWGDGNIETGTNSHMYSEEGTYNVKIIFNDVATVYAIFLSGDYNAGDINEFNIKNLNNLNQLWLNTLTINSINYLDLLNIVELGINNCPNLTNIPSNILTLKNLTINNCSGILSLPIETNLQTIDITSLSFTNFDFTIYPNLQSLYINYSIIDSIIYPSSLINLGMNSSTISTVDLTNLLSLQTISISTCSANNIIFDNSIDNYNIVTLINWPNLINIDLKNVPVLAYLNVQYSESLTSIINFTDSPDCVWNFSGNSLDEMSVNNILIESNSIKTSIGSIKTLSINGGTNASPTGAGLTAKSYLISKNWNIISN